MLRIDDCRRARASRSPLVMGSIGFAFAESLCPDLFGGCCAGDQRGNVRGLAHARNRPGPPAMVLPVRVSDGSTRRVHRTTAAEKGVGSHFCEAPSRPFRKMGPDPFFRRQAAAHRALDRFADSWWRALRISVVPLVGSTGDLPWSLHAIPQSAEPSRPGSGRHVGLRPQRQLFAARRLVYAALSIGSDSRSARAAATPLSSHDIADGPATRRPQVVYGAPVVLFGGF